MLRAVIDFSCTAAQLHDSQHHMYNFNLYVQGVLCTSKSNILSYSIHDSFVYILLKSSALNEPNHVKKYSARHDRSEFASCIVKPWARCSLSQSIMTYFLQWLVSMANTHKLSRSWTLWLAQVHMHSASMYVCMCMQAWIVGVGGTWTAHIHGTCV